MISRQQRIVTLRDDAIVSKAMAIDQDLALPLGPKKTLYLAFFSSKGRNAPGKVISDESCASILCTNTDDIRLVTASDCALRTTGEVLRKSNPDVSGGFFLRAVATKLMLQYLIKNVTQGIIIILLFIVQLYHIVIIKFVKMTDPARIISLTTRKVFDNIFHIYHFVSP